MLQLPWAGHHTPERVGVVRADHPGLLIEELEDRHGAGRRFVEVANRPVDRLLVPQMLWQGRDLAELVVGEEVRSVGSAEIEGDRGRAVDGGADDVVGVLPWGMG